ncbi:hypothetical protein AYI70_g1016 [Smittium culicis]|uniref:Uncharacterized protein n=1 Tax=Smittium culicis TaxID=133412 RepID=A0A1R1YE97_9FUNG|nr:hypothetical protein AYI70_g1016 [Smittium culicis]
MSVRNFAVSSSIFTDGISRFLLIMDVEIFNSPPRRLLNKGSKPEFCRLSVRFASIAERTLQFEAFRDESAVG